MFFYPLIAINMPSAQVMAKWQSAVCNNVVIKIGLTVKIL